MLAQLGVAFRVEIAAVDESPLPGEAPSDMTVRLALLKAHTVSKRVGAANPVLAGDTAVAIGAESLGKPLHRAHAVALLQRLSGATHMVYSAVALVAGGRQMHRLSATEVTFGHLEQRQIERYCDSDEPFDKAGGYGIQGRAGAFVKRIKGSYSGVVGLPLWETRQLLRQLQPPHEYP